MRNNSFDVVVLIAIGLGLGALYLSNQINAGFEETLYALLRSLGLLISAFLIHWWLQLSITVTSTGLACVLWPSWWSVIDSVARQDMLPASSWGGIPDQLPWWATDWFKYGVEFGFIVLFFFAMRHWMKYGRI